MLGSAMSSPADGRPDPDALLAQLQAQERTRGRLRIYFGANAGVGKTYAMLSAAQRERAGGRDVVAGVVETHGRAETLALLEGLEQLPLRQLAYRGRSLPEFDLDAALQRRPQVLLVDELAHSNVEGSRHPKRWHDVRELLDAGIDVWTTLNVQHLEGLNGTVGAITGIRVHETVPDTVLDQADEVVLVDATPDELVARLRAGKVYLPQQAERAAQNFFRKGNLMALREIALRRTAERVEDDVRVWRVEQSAGAPAPAGGWNTSGALLACVGPRSGAEHTVRSAARLAAQLNVRWHAVYVETPALQRLDAGRRDAILAVLRLAADLGASTAVLAASDIAGALATHARDAGCAAFVVGRGSPGWSPALAPKLARAAPELDIVEIARSDNGRRLERLLRGGAAGSGADLDRGAAAVAPRWPGYAVALAATVAITLVATPLHRLLDPANLMMLYLLGSVLVAWRYGRGPAALSALLSVAAFDFFFVPPRWSFAVSDVQYLLTFAVMLGVGLLVGQLTAGLRFTAEVAAGRERRTASLFALARDLSGALEAGQVAQLGQAAAVGHFGGQALVLVADARDALVWPAVAPAGLESSVADWVLRNGEPAGLATATLASQPWHYVPLKAPMRLRGVLALRPASPHWLHVPEQVQHLQTLARQVAIALERVHYVEIAQRALVDMESERLRNALLAAISHDVRTPLTALIGMAESLQAAQPPLAPAQAETAQALVRQARALATLTGNLLDMARLQSGAVALRLDWQSVEELADGALRALRTSLPGLRLHTDIPADLPLLHADAMLLQRVLVNLLENAAKYGAPPIELRARALPDTLLLAVRDHGPGLPPAWAGREAQLFDKFTRGETESAQPGAGLGLAICKAIVEAHGGRIEAANAIGGGAEFRLHLPRRPPPDA